MYCLQSDPKFWFQGRQFSKSGWMELWVRWSSWRYSFPWQMSWKRWSLRFFHLKQFGDFKILWFFDSTIPWFYNSSYTTAGFLGSTILKYWYINYIPFTCLREGNLFPKVLFQQSQFCCTSELVAVWKLGGYTSIWYYQCQLHELRYHQFLHSIASLRKDR